MNLNIKKRCRIGARIRSNPGQNRADGLGFFPGDFSPRGSTSGPLYSVFQFQHFAQ